MARWRVLPHNEIHGWVWGGHMSSMCVQVRVLKKWSCKLFRESLHLSAEAAVKFQQGSKTRLKVKSFPLSVVWLVVEQNVPASLFLCVLSTWRSTQNYAHDLGCGVDTASTSVTKCTNLEFILKSHKDLFTVEWSTPFKTTVVTQMWERWKADRNTLLQKLIEVWDEFQESKHSTSIWFTKPSLKKVGNKKSQLDSIWLFERFQSQAQILQLKINVGWIINKLNPA